MKVLIFPTAQAAVGNVVHEISKLVTGVPNARLGLATGGTMEPVYAGLVAQKPDMSGVSTFNLDEYVGLPPDHPQCYRTYMETHLFRPLGLKPEQTHLPAGDAQDPAQEAIDYENLIADGGIDLQLLGLGVNGHIGFNEPSSSLASPTRLKTLTKRTRADNARYFAADEQVPHYAITMGIATIMQARDIIILANGAGKADAVAAMVEGPIAAICPASILQMHPRVRVVIDEAAAAHLTLRDYYETVHPSGNEPAL